MKVGDLVKFKIPLYEDIYLIIGRHKTWDGWRHNNSKFAQWEIINCITGKVLKQAAKDLEVLSESR